MVHIYKLQISNSQIHYIHTVVDRCLLATTFMLHKIANKCCIRNKIKDLVTAIQVSAPETILGLEIGFGCRLMPASVTPTITDSDSALLGCCQVKIMYFGSGCEKMPEWHPLHTPPGPCRRHRVNSFWVGPIHVIVAYTGLRTVWSHSRTWSLTFFQKCLICWHRYQNIEFDLSLVFGLFSLDTWYWDWNCVHGPL